MKKSYLIAAAVALAIAGWMVAGSFGGGEQSAAVETGPAEAEEQGMSVAVETLQARAVARHIVAQGQVEPNRIVTLRAETAGRVAEVVAREGQTVAAGDVLVRLEMDDRKARLTQADAQLKERRGTYEAARKLGEKGYQTNRRVDETFSAFQSAEATLRQIQLEIEKTTLRAPFGGILETRQVEVGDYLPVNGEVATIVDNDPLVAVVRIAQQDIGRIELGALVEVAFATGQSGTGAVRLIAPRAEEATRTFRVEIEVPNPGSRIPSGASAEASIPTGAVTAQFVSPALLSLNTAGQIGVKTVTEGDLVAFHPVEIVRAEAKGVWVSGLPERARVITVGQGFVREGESVRVAPVSEQPATDRAGPERGDSDQIASRP